MSFDDLGLSPELLKAVQEAGYTNPTPIQQNAIPYALMGRDVLGTAQTGTGKTAAFLLPAIDILDTSKAKARMPRALILEPTRELAIQVEEAFDVYTKYHQKLSTVVLMGGVSYGDQDQRLLRGVDVIIATPGRLLDSFERGRVMMSGIKYLVIDEADRMMDMGFMPDVERIVGLLPKIRQTLFFSATMPNEIKRLADAFLTNPKEIAVSAPSSAAETVTQGMAVVDERDKREALRQLIKTEEVRNALIFCNRKRDVAVLYRSMKKHGFNVAQLHGDMDQGSRTETMEMFREGKVDMLVCSDVAARGLDIQGLSHVFNFDVPMNAEDYVHRIGRTGRAGLPGRAFTLATPSDTKFVQDITKLIGRDIPEIQVEGFENLEFDDSARRGGRRRSPRRDTAKSDTPRRTKSKRTANDDKPASKKSAKSEEKPASASKKAESSQKRRPKTSKKKNEPREPREPVMGMGDHTPAFLSLPIRRRQKPTRSSGKEPSSAE